MRIAPSSALVKALYFTLYRGRSSLRASPPGLVQTAAVNKIVVFVDNKSREGRVWRAVYLDGVAPEPAR
jgi:hypothetical protein